MASPTRPGVEVIQELQETPAVTASPVLVPVMVGVCNQIITTLDSEGALNPDAKFDGEQYNQASVFITQADFPDPRGNIDELNIDEATVEAALYFGGRLFPLERGSHDSFGKAFLEAANLSKRAAVRSTEADSYSFDAVVGDVLTLAFDVVNTSNVSKDVVVTLLGTLTTEEVVDEINDVVGVDVATVFEDTAGDFGPPGAKYVQIASQTYGAVSSVTLRAGTSALKLLFGAGFDDSQEYRVEGAGFRAQDDGDDDLFAPWIEFYRGVYSEDGSDTTFPADNTSDMVWAGLIDIDGDFTNAKAAAVTYTGTSPTVPLKAATSSVPGDQLWADGVQVGGSSAEVIKVESSRFQIGRLNLSLSTFDDDGDAVVRVYDTVEVNTPSHGNPFAPKYAYFVAQGLVWGSVSPAGVAATITGSGGSGDITEERAAVIFSTADISLPVNLASLTLEIQITEDGVQADTETFTFTGGPFSTIGEIVTALTGAISGVTVSSSDDKLVLSTTKTGSDQSISLKSTGTANTALNFSTTADTEDTGKDVEYVGLATLTSELISLPLVGITSATLEVIVTDSKGSHTVTVAGVDLATGVTDLGDLVDAIAVAFGGTAVTDRTLYDGPVEIATIESSTDTDISGTITLKTVEGGASVSFSITATDGTDGFRHVGFYDSTGGEWPEVTGTGPLVFPIASLSGKTLSVDWDDGTGPYTLTAVLGAPEAAAASASALAALLNATSGLTDALAARQVWYIGDDVNDTITIRSVQGGVAISLDVDAGGGTAGLDLGFVEASNDTDVGVDSLSNTDASGTDGLLGTQLGFFLDDNPFEFKADFVTNSLQDAIDEVNTLVGGATDVASETTSFMTLTSQMKGSASKVEINDSSTGAVVLGLSGEALGSGRPDPNFYLDGAGNAVVGASILRNGTTGQPFSLESAIADIYLGYTALRLDVSPMAEDPGLVTFGTVDDLEAAIGPIDVNNPLALGAFLALQNAPAVNISVIGLDETNSPEGTIDAWARALEFLESREVYTVVPLTGDKFINGLVSTHVQTMSLPTNRGERIALLWQPVPTRDPDTILTSGTDAETNGTDNSVTLETNAEPDIVAAGISTGGTIPVSEGLFLELLVAQGGSTELRNYSIEEVNGVILLLRTSFASGENDDGFFSVETLDGASSLDNLDWSIKIRGDELLLAGTTRKDLNAVAEAAASEASAYQSRRVYLLFCDDVETPVGGITQRVPGYYAAAAIAGMVAQLEPQQPFTNLPITGLGRVYGTDDTFSENQMDVVADGGRYVLVNQGGSVASRHSRSTDPTTIEARELSITKSIDWLAKGLRSTNRVFIGRYVITPNFLDQLSMANSGFLELALLLGVVADAKLRRILQSEDEPDTILIEVEATPQYPSNKIRITIVV